MAWGDSWLTLSVSYGSGVIQGLLWVRLMAWEKRCRGSSSKSVQIDPAPGIYQEEKGIMMCTVRELVVYPCLDHGNYS